LTGGAATAAGATAAVAAPIGPFAEDAFIPDVTALAALRTALAAGFLDGLGAGRPDAAAALERLPHLAAVLERSGVLRRTGGGLALTPAFRATIDARGRYLAARLDFIALAMRDLLAFGDALFLDVPRFMARSETFALFRYDRARGTDPLSLDRTRPWVDYVTGRTLVEAPHLAPAMPLDGVRRLLEIGGNTGAFALALLARQPGLEAIVVDLPAVCALGQGFAAGQPDAARLRFVAADARRDPLPGPVDLVVFKSVLHDWPEPEAAALIDRAAGALAPGGRMAICERAPLEAHAAPTGPAGAEDRVFAPFFRPAAVYARLLQARGFAAQVSRPSPVLPFYLVVGAGR
jgi:SAM-dependent methyltransferase